MRRFGVLTAVWALACGSSSEPSPSPADIAADAQADDSSADATSAPTLTLAVVLPVAHPGLAAAADDLVAIVKSATGGEGGSVLTDASAEVPKGATRVAVVLEPDAPQSAQGFQLTSSKDGLEVRATTPVGAMYGLYGVAQDLGAFWLQPEESWVRPNADLALPTYPGDWDTPRFELRGFHEHTQHPIPMSDYLLRPGTADFRERASRYLRWLARNRQNVLFFHALKTLDLAKWTPYMQSITAEAAGYGIHVGAVIGFADEQQNAFKLIPSGASGEDADAAIRSGIDSVLAAGLDLIGFQIGTSEFTKPGDAEVLHWLDVATAHIIAAHPSVSPFAWIHITCDLLADDSSKFFHLPLKADPRLGAFVHTTMFYSVDVPAPVYSCEDFGHQMSFIDSAAGNRKLVFFPETAWWLGFDNNVPLVLPITGRSRDTDIAKVTGRGVSGHVTFTSGREWTYWQYDHYLTRATWSGEHWADYLSAIAPVYGEAGGVVTQAIDAVGAIQDKLLYEDNPELIFTLAGELPQDEAGAQAGILARRPKIAFKTVVEYDQATFDAWKTHDYDRLVALKGELETALAPLLATPTESPDPGVHTRLVEVVEAYRLLLKRVEHAIVLYGGAIDIRNGDRAAAEQALVAARAISAEVKASVATVEATYRDPLPILAEAKPETLTAYPIGYLAETRTVYFWTRRDEQLDTLITVVFDAAPEAWTKVPAALYAIKGDGIALTEPESSVAASVLGGFLPRLLIGVDVAGDSATLTLAEDANENGLPDPGSELPLSAPIVAGRFAAGAPRFDLVVHDATGKAISTVGLLDLKLDLALDAAGALGTGTLRANLETTPLVDAVLAIAGIDKDGIESLIKGVFLVPDDQPLPAALPCAFALTPTKVE